MPVRCVSSEVDATILTCSGRSPTSTSVMCEGRPCSMWVRQAAGSASRWRAWAAPFSRVKPAGDDVDLGIADEAGHVAVGRLVIELLRLGDLPHLALEQDADGVRERQRLVCSPGVAKTKVRPRSRCSRFSSVLSSMRSMKSRLESGFVEQVEARLPHHGAAQRHALALARR